MTTTDDVRPSGDAAARVLELHAAEIAARPIPDGEPDWDASTRWSEACWERDTEYRMLAPALAKAVQELRAREAALVEALRGFPHTMPSPMDIALQGRAPIRHWSIARRRLYDSISAIVAAHDARLARGEDAG